jgi:hypothetical protein
MKITFLSHSGRSSPTYEVVLYGWPETEWLSNDDEGGAKAENLSLRNLLTLSGLILLNCLSCLI